MTTDHSDLLTLLRSWRTADRRREYSTAQYYLTLLGEAVDRVEAEEQERKEETK